MDTQWYRPWKSTVADFNNVLLTKYAKKYTYLQSPSTKKVQLLRTELECQTLLLEWRDQTAWVKRGKVFLGLRFPELAVGDLYKALQLADSRNKEPVMLLLAQALFMANSFLECVELLDQAVGGNKELKRLKRYARTAFDQEQQEARAEYRFTDGERGTEQRVLEYDLSGEVVVQPYPWIRTSWLSRRGDVLTAVSQELEARSCGQCEVRRSAISGLTHDCYGIFAKTNIPRDKHIFSDVTVLSATSGLCRRCGCCAGELAWSQTKLMCCDSSALFCSWSCAQTARSTYHKPLCKQGTDDSNAGSTTPDGANDHEASDRLWLRILAAIKRSLDAEPSLFKHPLDVATVNQFTSNPGSVVRFSLKRDIIVPNQALQKLGVDAFSDLRFDTWVLRTIAGRWATNVRECTLPSEYENGPVTTCMLAINTLYSFLNHSCEPNVEVILDDKEQNSTVVLQAKKSLRKGEELYISYLDEDQLGAGHEERAELLKFWTGGICNCSKCRKQREMLYHGTDDEFQPGKSDDSDESEGIL